MTWLGRVVNIPNAASDWRYDPTVDEGEETKRRHGADRTKTILALPVKVVLLFHVLVSEFS